MTEQEYEQHGYGLTSKKMKGIMIWSAYHRKKCIGHSTNRDQMIAAISEHHEQYDRVDQI